MGKLISAVKDKEYMYTCVVMKGVLIFMIFGTFSHLNVAILRLLRLNFMVNCEEPHHAS